MKKNKIFTSNWFYYLVITFYALLLIFINLDFNFNNLYGSTVDWLSQHSVIPEYFRQIFYETGNLVPNLALNLGSGQNIFNYSYYGLLSPIILVSYLLPFINMTTYICLSSIILYILTGIFFFRFSLNNKFDKSLSLFLSLALITISPVSYHFHHHIMFVNYLPFLILSLIGVDKYLKDKKSLLLIISTFLVIMTNYYYSVCSLLVIFVYGVYKILAKGEDDIKTIIKDIFYFGIRLLTSVLMACIILLPTAYTILGSGRNSSNNITLSSLLIPNFKEILYKNYSIGITAMFLISLFGILSLKKVKKSDLFLIITTIILTIIPVVTYILNGALYVRGKVLIPFVLIYLFIFGLFMKYLFNDNINLKKISIAYIGLNIFVFITGYTNYYFYLDLILAFILTLGTLKYRKRILIYLPTLLILISLNLGFNQAENYVTKDYYEQVNNKDVITLINKINKEDNSFYRTLNSNIEKDVVNKVYNQNYYQTTIYSSVYNNLYRDFYYQNFGNNIKYRNRLITAGADNTLFNTLMGVKYIVGSHSPLGYNKIDDYGSANLYYNPNVYPIIYVSNNLGSTEEYDGLSFPYNIEYMMNNTVVDKINPPTFNTTIKDYQISNMKEKYSLNLSENTTYNITLDKAINNQILFIEFDMNYNEGCKHDDQFITINGSMNKLTCKTWLYHNGNNKFRYVISSNDDINELEIEVGKGKYEIENIKTYIMDYNINNNYINIKNLIIDKKSSTIKGNVNVTNDAYLTTSIPFDKGFTAYIDGKKVSTEIVNKAFLGFKIESGEHELLIKYKSPWYKEGIISSFIGFAIMIIISIFECKKIRCLVMNILKNREMIMYLIFGILTTVVSLCTYYLCTYTFLDANNKFQLQCANVIAWIVAVIFAYVTNRKYVFNSSNNNVKKEFLDFCKSRLITLLLDMSFMYIFVSMFKFNDKIIKAIVQVLIIISNYVFSKLLVFKGEGK